MATDRVVPRLNILRTNPLFLLCLQLPLDTLLVTAVSNFISQRQKCAKTTSLIPANDAPLAAPQTTLDRSKYDWDPAEGLEPQFFDKLLAITMKIKDTMLAKSCAYGIVKELPMGM